MVAIELLNELKKFIEDVVKNYVLETKCEIKKEPQVVIGYLPPKGETDIPDYPYVIIRALSGADEEDSSIVKINLIVGTFSESYEGWMDVLNIVQRIRQRLLEKMVISNKFKIGFPLEWDLFEEQPLPEWNALIKTNWIINRPYQVIDERGEYIGW